MASRPISGDDYQIGDPSFGKMSLIGAQSESNDVDANGKPTADIAARRFYYFPFLALKKIEDGSIIIKEPTSNTIIIPLVLNTPSTREIFQKHLLNEHLINENTNPGNIQMASISRLEVRTYRAYKYNIIFNPIQINPNREAQISVRIDDVNIKNEFISDFRAGNVSLEAVIFFKGYDIEENSAEISYEQLRSSHTYMNILGPGGKGIATREKVAEMAKEAIKNTNIFIKTEYDDPDFTSLVLSILNQSTVEQVSINEDLSNIQDKFDEAGINSNDFAADVIESSKLIENEEKRRDFSEDITKIRDTALNTGGSANVFKVVDASGHLDAKYIGTDVRKTMENVYSKYGIDSSWNGKMVIPKSIKIYRLEDSKLRGAGKFTVGTAKMRKSDGQREWSIDPDINFFVFSGDDIIITSNQFAAVGTIHSFGGENLPYGYLFCDGQEYDRLTYKLLFDVIGTRWGPSTDTTFSVPELRGEFLKGAGKDGRAVGTSEEDSTRMPHTPFIVTDSNSTHSHDIPTSTATATGVDFPMVSVAKGQLADQILVLPGGGYHSHVLIGGDPETRPANKAVNFIIKFK